MKKLLMVLLLLSGGVWADGEKGITPEDLHAMVVETAEISQVLVENVVSMMQARLNNDYMSYDRGYANILESPWSSFLPAIAKQMDLAVIGAIKYRDVQTRYAVVTGVGVGIASLLFVQGLGLLGYEIFKPEPEQ